jgi:hypothetical protein
VKDQQKRVREGHLHRDLLEKAFWVLRAVDQNVYACRTGTGKAKTAAWYMNSTDFHWAEGVDENVVTLSRVDKFFKSVTSKMYSVEEFKTRYRSLREIKKVSQVINGRLTFRLVCDCVAYWNSNSHCAHVVLVYHILGVIDVCRLMGDLMTVRKHGRPTTSEMALERNRDQVVQIVCTYNTGI